MGRYKKGEERRKLRGEEGGGEGGRVEVGRVKEGYQSENLASELKLCINGWRGRGDG